MNHDNIGQYNCIKQTARSESYFLSRVSNIPYKMHMLVFSWEPIFGFMQYLEPFVFLEYLLWVENEGCRNENVRSFFDAIINLE